MANDENLAVRVSVLEIQMATLVEDVAEIRANYVTKQYLEERLARFKAELMAELNPRFAEIDARFAEINARLDNCATKEELHQMEQRLRNWILGLFFVQFFSLTGLLLAILQLTKH